MKSIPAMAQLMTSAITAVPRGLLDPRSVGDAEIPQCPAIGFHQGSERLFDLALAAPLKRGGRLALDCYPRLAANILWPKYWLRPVTRRLPQARLFAIVRRVVPALLPIARAIAAIPWLGRRLRYLLPIMTYYRVLPLTDDQQREWAILDTFDMLAPAHDHPQTEASIRTWLTEAGLGSIEAAREGLIVARAVKG